MASAVFRTFRCQPRLPWFGTFGILFALSVHAGTAPTWWGSPTGADYGIYDETQTQGTDNWAVANVGQLKQIATLAKSHIDATLGPSAGDWTSAYAPDASPFPFSTASNPENFSPALIGQLKFTALGFYKIIQARRGSAYVEARLVQMGVTTISVYDGTVVPWISDMENKSPVLIGQLKAVFSFDLSLGTSVVVPAQLPIPAWMRADLAASGAPYGTAFTVNSATMESPGGTSGPVRLQVLHPQ